MQQANYDLQVKFWKMYHAQIEHKEWTLALKNQNARLENKVDALKWILTNLKLYWIEPTFLEQPIDTYVKTKINLNKVAP